MRIFVGVFLLALTSACSDFEKSNQLNQVAGLVKKTDSLLIVLNQLNDNLLTDELNQNKKLLSEYVSIASTDTLLEVEAKFVDRYDNYIDRITSLTKQINNIEKTLLDQKAELKHLEKDIENSAGKRDRYNQYLKFEQKKFSIIEKELQSIKAKKIYFISKIATFKLKMRNEKQKLKSKQRTK